jgi:hypothetical protein
MSGPPSNVSSSAASARREKRENKDTSERAEVRCSAELGAWRLRSSCREHDQFSEQVSNADQKKAHSREQSDDRFVESLADDKRGDQSSSD